MWICQSGTDMQTLFLLFYNPESCYKSLLDQQGISYSEWFTRVDVTAWS